MCSDEITPPIGSLCTPTTIAVVGFGLHELAPSTQHIVAANERCRRKGDAGRLIPIAMVSDLTNFSVCQPAQTPGEDALVFVSSGSSAFVANAYFRVTSCGFWANVIGWTGRCIAGMRTRSVEAA
jgi:hypothetical protein